MAVALDSDAVIGFLDRSDALHSAARDAVQAAAREGLVVSAVVYAEVLTGLFSQGDSSESLTRFLDELVVDVVALDAPVAARAARLRVDAPGLRMPDALVVASAERHEGVSALISGDRRLAKLGGLEIEVRLLRA